MRLPLPDGSVGSVCRARDDVLKETPLCGFHMDSCDRTDAVLGRERALTVPSQFTGYWSHVGSRRGSPELRLSA